MAYALIICAMSWISDATIKRSLSSISRLVSGPIDVDELDYLRRDAMYTGVAMGNVDHRRILNVAKIVGYVVALPLGDQSADIESIAVDPDYQGKGTGGLLLDAIEREMSSRGFVNSVLEVRDRNI